MLINDGLKYTKIYEDFEDGEVKVYVRICPIETERFGHGIALATVFTRETRDQAISFAKDVDQYIDAMIASTNKRK